MALPFDPTTLHPLWYGAAFALFWFGGAALMARLAGWHALSRLHPAPLRLRGEQMRFCSVAMGRPGLTISYRRCVRVIVSEEGFGLCLMFPFRFHSPPFFAPWSAVAACTEKQLLTNRKVSFVLTGCPQALTFAGPLGQLMKDLHRRAMAVHPSDRPQP